MRTGDWVFDGVRFALVTAEPRYLTPMVTLVDLECYDRDGNYIETRPSSNAHGWRLIHPPRFPLRRRFHTLDDQIRYR